MSVSHQGTARFKVFALPHGVTSTDTDWVNYPGVIITTDGDCTHYFKLPWSDKNFVAPVKDSTPFAQLRIRTLEVNYTASVPVPIYITPTINVNDMKFYVMRNNITTADAGDPSKDPATVVSLVPQESDARAGWIWSVVGAISGVANYFFPGWGDVVSAGFSFVIKVAEKLLSRVGDVYEAVVGKHHGLIFKKADTFRLVQIDLQGTKYFGFKVKDQEYFLVDGVDNLIPYKAPSSRASPINLHTLALPTPTQDRANTTVTNTSNDQSFFAHEATQSSASSSCSFDGKSVEDSSSTFSDVFGDVFKLVQHNGALFLETIRPDISLPFLKYRGGVGVDFDNIYLPRPGFKE